MNLGGSYTADIDSCMGPCRTHPAVAFMQEIRRTNGISYDAVMSMALLLKYCDGRFVLMPQQETMLDKRWATVDKERFLALLSDFHARSRFRDFFVAHEPLYAAGIAAFRESIMTGFDQTWYADFTVRKHRKPSPSSSVSATEDRTTASDDIRREARRRRYPS